eukprot:TRINITY_DN54342_c0_g1_i1.p1 TRINITY_DN54342_c0_g1~~TRINITY_DN54342_c0_g1_i1.p1  ORF type:complete len:984 (-),score=157.39 TRINITY_DN54342_c0_g1_i1:164-2884(-)
MDIFMRNCTEDVHKKLVDEVRAREVADARLQKAMDQLKSDQSRNISRLEKNMIDDRERITENVSSLRDRVDGIERDIDGRLVTLNDRVTELDQTTQHAIDDTVKKTESLVNSVDARMGGALADLNALYTLFGFNRDEISTANISATQVPYIHNTPAFRSLKIHDHQQDQQIEGILERMRQAERTLAKKAQKDVMEEELKTLTKNLDQYVDTLTNLIKGGDEDTLDKAREILDVTADTKLDKATWEKTLTSLVTKNEMNVNVDTKMDDLKNWLQQHVTTWHDQHTDTSRNLDNLKSILQLKADIGAVIKKADTEELDKRMLGVDNKHEQFNKKLAELLKEIQSLQTELINVNLKVAQATAAAAAANAALQAGSPPSVSVGGIQGSAISGSSSKLVTQKGSDRRGSNEKDKDKDSNSSGNGNGSSTETPVDTGPKKWERKHHDKDKEKHVTVHEPGVDAEALRKLGDKLRAVENDTLILQQQKITARELEDGLTAVQEMWNAHFQAFQREIQKAIDQHHRQINQQLAKQREGGQNQHGGHDGASGKPAGSDPTDPLDTKGDGASATATGAIGMTPSGLGTDDMEFDEGSVGGTLLSMPPMPIVHITPNSLGTTSPPPHHASASAPGQALQPGTGPAHSIGIQQGHHQPPQYKYDPVYADSEPATMLRFRCLSCNRVAGPLHEPPDGRPGTRKEFPPQSVFMHSSTRTAEKDNAPSTAASGSKKGKGSRPSSAAASTAGSVTGGAQPSIASGAHAPSSTGAPSTVCTSNLQSSTRKKLQNYYEWLAYRTQEKRGTDSPSTAQQSSPREGGMAVRSSSPPPPGERGRKIIGKDGRFYAGVLEKPSYLHQVIFPDANGNDVAAEFDLAIGEDMALEGTMRLVSAAKNAAENNIIDASPTTAEETGDSTPVP